MIIYIDVLLLINLYVTYFELLGVCALSHRKAGRARLLLASCIGSISALSIFLPQDALLGTLIKIVSCVLITLAAFGFHSGAQYITVSLLLLAVSFIFAGLCFAVWLFWAPMKMLYSNGTVYFDIDFMTILICTVLSYAILRVIRRFFDRNGECDKKYSITIENNGRSCTIDALSDSANGLVDYFSGLPVIICRADSCADVSPPIAAIAEKGAAAGISDEYMSKIRVLPFSTVSGSGYVYAFRASKITINDIEGKKSYPVNALIGVTKTDRQKYAAIFNPKMLC